MAQVQTPARVVKIDYACDAEGCDGVQRPIEHAAKWLANPPQFPHACTVCSRKMTFTLKYPTYGYVDDVCPSSS